MLPSRRLNRSVPSWLPTTDIDTLISPRGQRPPSRTIRLDVALKLCLLALLILFLFLLVFVLVFLLLPKQHNNLQVQSRSCILPAYPENGAYMHPPVAEPGERFESLNLTVYCEPGYRVLGTENVYCHNGSWSDYIPKCIPFCKLDKHVSVHYHCRVNGTTKGSRPCNAYEPSGTVVRPKCNSPKYYSSCQLPDMRCIEGTWDRVVLCSPASCKLDKHVSVHYHCRVNGTTKSSRACNVYEPSGTVVRPKCNSPKYYSSYQLPDMRCIEGSWDRVVLCSPDCGRVTLKDPSLVLHGRSAEHRELPWHVGIYRKNEKPYLQICGGSLISDRLVISAAHCFWNDILKLLPASGFAVAAGKIYRPWLNTRDEYTQKSDVKEIKITDHFHGNEANHQDDIAVLILEIVFLFNSFVRAICLDFNVGSDRKQLQPGKLGKVAGWGLTEKNGNASQILKVVELPYIDTQQCFESSPLSYRKYITSDKFCAGYGNGTTLCPGDSGGGLAFLEAEQDRFYLRGVVSTALTSEDKCNSKSNITFTHLLWHEHFIKKYL